MQPYFFPYLGYWQLLNYVDNYVIYDDVNFIKGGWVNRNKILLDGQEHYINLPMSGASSNKHINQVGVGTDKVMKGKTLKLLEHAYCKAPYFENAIKIPEQILTHEYENLADCLVESIQLICYYLGISTPILRAQSMEIDPALRGQDRVLDTCKLLKTDSYINAIGGQSIYSYDAFRKCNMQLKFLDMKDITYPQFGGAFISKLSIIDVMMFNSQEVIAEKFLNAFDLVEE
jgi:WbqC-like protein family